MAVSRLDVLTILAFISCPAVASESVDARTALYLNQLLAHPENRIVKDWSACPSGSKSPTVASELARILIEFADNSLPLKMQASCQPADDGNEFCTFSFSVTGEEEQASAGFTYIGSQADSKIDFDSIACFQTP